MLLSDNYSAGNDYFQAKSTLKSLIDNYEKNPDDQEDIKAIAAEKLSAITARENELQNKELRENQKPIPAETDSINTGSEPQEQ